MFLKLLTLLSLAFVQVWGHGLICTTCVNIDAAITMNGKIYLFDNTDVITLNDKFEEDGAFKSYEKWPGFPTRIQAALTWPSNNNMPYFFHWSTYSVFRDGKLDKKEYQSTGWSPFVAKGVDAVGITGETVYFMKGCEYQTRNMHNYHSYSTIKDMREFHLPCDVDAALTIDGKMVVIKGSKYWSVDGTNKAVGPLYLQQIFKITSFNLCPAYY